MKIRFLLPCAFLVTSSLWGAPAARYRIEAEIDVHRKIISGSETVVLRNSTAVPLNDLCFFLYPNRFQKKSPSLNEMNYLWHYPSGFEKGQLTLGAIRSLESTEVLSSEILHPAGLPEGTVCRLSLVDPLEPGSERSVRIDFEAKLPHKYGPLGHYRDTLTAQGEWYPYLVPLSENGHPLFHGLPQESSFNVRLKLNAPRDAVVNGVFFDDVTEIDLPAQEALYVTLVITPQFHVQSRKEGSKTVLFYGLREKRYKLEKLMTTLSRVVKEATAFFPVETPDEIAVVETYLRAVMSFPGERLVLTSDRLFITPAQFDLRNLNRLEMASAMSRSLVSDRVVERESPLDYNWVAEILGRAFRDKFLATNFEHLSNLRETAGRMGRFRPFNRMAASPTIPFSETYVGDVIKRDRLRESLLYFNNELPSGQLFAEKLEKTIGEKAYEKVLQGYLRQDENFQSFVTDVQGQGPREVDVCAALLYPR